MQLAGPFTSENQLAYIAINLLEDRILKVPQNVKTSMKTQSIVATAAGILLSIGLAAGCKKDEAKDTAPATATAAKTDAPKTAPNKTDKTAVAPAAGTTTVDLAVAGMT